MNAGAGNGASGEGHGDERSMRERMLGGGPYIADDPELAEFNARALDLQAAFNATTVRQGPLRRQLLEQLLGSIGEETEIRPPIYVDYGSQITIGSRCFANYGLDVQIGDNTVWQCAMT